jgi:regulator of nucleoside diphosphate kinase
MNSIPPLIISDLDVRRIEGLLASRSADAAGVSDALEAELARAEVRPNADVPADVVMMNSTVLCADETTGVQREVRLVYPGESISEGDVSILAPVGAALLGLRAGQTIEWPLPGGRTTRLRVSRVLSRPATAVTGIV